MAEAYGRCPCDSGWISQGYHSKHKAIDIGFLTKYGKNLPVYAWKSGTVIATGTDSAGGVFVVLQHDDNSNRWISRYWHFVKGSVVVKKGQTVKQGDKLGTRGNTGISSGVHLHFELWKCPKGYSYKSSDYSKYAVDPMKYTYLFDGQVMQGTQILPTKPIEKVEPKPVAVDVSKWQVEVIADSLRVRTSPSLNGEQYCICPKGIFDVIQSQEADGYTWYEIEPSRWIATKEGHWTFDRQIVKVPTQEEVIIDLRKQIDKLNTELELKEKTLTATENALKDALNIIEDVRKAVV